MYSGKKSGHHPQKKKKRERKMYNGFVNTDTGETTIGKNSKSYGKRTKKSKKEIKTLRQEKSLGSRRLYRDDRN